MVCEDRRDMREMSAWSDAEFIERCRAIHDDTVA
jgi:hypothetical protein